MDRDTSAVARARYHQLLRERLPYERLAQAVALTKMVRELAVAGIRTRHPHATDDEVRARLTARLYGRRVAERLFANLPDDAI